MPETTASVIVAGNVRAEAARARLTQGQLAGILGASQQAISDRLRGRTPFSVDELAQLAEAMSVPIARFLPSLAAVPARTEASAC